MATRFSKGDRAITRASARVPAETGTVLTCRVAGLTGYVKFRFDRDGAVLCVPKTRLTHIEATNG